MAEHGGEKYPRSTRVTPPQEVDSSKQGAPDSVHQKAVTEWNVNKVERICDHNPRLNDDLFDSGSKKQNPQNIGKCSGQNECAERNFGRGLLCSEADCEMSHE